jgi:hypothetical protein
MKSQTDRIREAAQTLGPVYFELVTRTLKLPDRKRWNSEQRDRFLGRARTIIWAMRLDRETTEEGGTPNGF